eukprot:1170485-Amorphochlora_amoeboformis.AAC.1
MKFFEEPLWDDDDQTVRFMKSGHYYEGSKKWMHSMVYSGSRTVCAGGPYLGEGEGGEECGWSRDEKG